MAIEQHKVAKYISRQKLSRFFNIQSDFLGRLVFFTFVRESFHVLALLLSLFSFSRVSVRLSLLFYKFKEKKQKRKNCLNYESHKELCRESVINIKCISMLSKGNKIGEK